MTTLAFDNNIVYTVDMARALLTTAIAFALPVMVMYLA
jgi:hypothetical protein